MGYSYESLDIRYSIKVTVNNLNRTYSPARSRSLIQVTLPRIQTMTRSFSSKLIEGEWGFPLPGEIKAEGIVTLYNVYGNIATFSGEQQIKTFGPVTFTCPCSCPGTGTPGYWMNHPEAWPVSRDYHRRSNVHEDSSH